MILLREKVGHRPVLTCSPRLPRRGLLSFPDWLFQLGRSQFSRAQLGWFLHLCAYPAIPNDNCPGPTPRAVLQVT